MKAQDTWAQSLANARPDLERTSTAERVVEVLRRQITIGRFAPGARLPEEAVAEALGVSRNTVREAFRLLAHERLLDYEFNKGVFVRKVSAADVAEIYRVRRLVEVAAIARADGASGGELADLAEVIEAGEQAAREGDWPQVGTSDLDFHQGIIHLAGSTRLDEIMRRVFAELRLVFHVMDDPQRFHEPYLARNRTLLTMLESGRYEAATDSLDTYLCDAQRQILAAYQVQQGGVDALP